MKTLLSCCHLPDQQRTPSQNRKYFLLPLANELDLLITFIEEIDYYRANTQSHNYFENPLKCVH